MSTAHVIFLVIWRGAETKLEIYLTMRPYMRLSDLQLLMSDRYHSNQEREQL